MMSNSVVSHQPMLTLCTLPKYATNEHKHRTHTFIHTLHT
nr:MAG TPA: hypothetical protein [Caudoviricetes sp.]